MCSFLSIVGICALVLLGVALIYGLIYLIDDYADLSSTVICLRDRQDALATTYLLEQYRTEVTRYRLRQAESDEKLAKLEETVRVLKLRTTGRDLRGLVKKSK